MNDLLENLRRFLAAGDAERRYQLTRDEVALLVAELEKLQPVPVLTFADIKRGLKHD